MNVLKNGNFTKVCCSTTIKGQKTAAEHQTTEELIPQAVRLSFIKFSILYPKWQLNSSWIFKKHYETLRDLKLDSDQKYWH